MGLDIECIIDNHFEIEEIWDLPSLINNEWTDLRELIEYESKNFLVPQKKLEKNTKWEFDSLNEEEIEDYWKYFENDSSENPYPKKDIWFFSYFGMIKIYRKVIVINPFCLRFKAFKNEDAAKKSLVKIVRAIVNLFDAKKVLYCSDSFTKTEILSNMAMEGKSLQEIIDFSKLTIGHPNSDYLKAIDETYFIDDFSLKLE